MGEHGGIHAIKSVVRELLYLVNELNPVILLLAAISFENIDHLFVTVHFLDKFG